MDDLLATVDAPAISPEDRWAISDTLARYCMALDDRAFDRLETVFAADLVWDYGAFGAGTGRDALVEMIRRALAPIDATQHFLGTQLSTATPDGAHVRTYVTTPHVRYAAEAGNLFTVAGWYHDDLVRTGDGWRITRRTYENAWSQGNPGVFVAGARHGESSSGAGRQAA